MRTTSTPRTGAPRRTSGSPPYARSWRGGRRGGDTPAEQLARELDEAEREYAGAREAASALHPAQEELRAAEREHELRTAAQRDAAVRAAARVGHRERLDLERATLEQELAQARGDAPSVAARAGQLERQAALLTDAADAARAAEAAARRLKDADARLADAAFRAGFDTRGPPPTPSSTTPPTGSCNAGWTPGTTRRPPYAPSSPNRRRGSRPRARRRPRRRPARRRGSRPRRP